MPRAHGLSGSQLAFLRQYMSNPGGVPVHAYPSPVIFARWMRRAPFRRALKSIRDALRFEQDMHLAAASVEAARKLCQGLGSDQPEVPRLATQKEQIQQFTSLLRLSHVREKLTKDYEPPEPEAPRSMRAAQRQEFMEFLNRYNPLQSVRAPLGDLEAEERYEKQEREKEQRETELRRAA